MALKGLIENTLLKDNITITQSVDELKSKINASGRYDVQWISDTEFKFLSKISIGTMMVDGMIVTGDGIKGYGRFQEKENGKVLIELTTKVRPEMYMIIGVFFIILFFPLFIDENFPLWIFLTFPVFIVWFWWVYRFQEKRLFKKLKEDLMK